MKTQIISTIKSKSTVEKIINNQVPILRINCSYQTIKQHKKMIQYIKSLNTKVKVLLDMPGKKIRIKMLPKDIILKKDQLISLNHIPTTYSLVGKLKQGQSIFIDDGKIMLVVVNEKTLTCKVENPGKLKSGKGVNVPDLKFTDNNLTQDPNSPVFELAELVDWVGISFVSSQKHIESIKAKVPGKKIVAKIETKSALKNINEIIKSSDYIMIARGDLAIEATIEKLGIYQKYITKQCIKNNTPFIVATGILNSMVKNTYPSRAEVLDVTNSILDGASYLMLADETTIGKHPIKAIQTLQRIIHHVESANF